VRRLEPPVDPSARRQRDASAARRRAMKMSVGGPGPSRQGRCICVAESTLSICRFRGLEGVAWRRPRATGPATRSANWNRGRLRRHCPEDSGPRARGPISTGRPDQTVRFPRSSIRFNMDSAAPSLSISLKQRAKPALSYSRKKWLGGLAAPAAGWGRGRIFLSKQMEEPGQRKVLYTD